MLYPPVYVIDNNTEDKETILEAWADLDYRNNIQFFTTGEEALAVLLDDKNPPLLILCEIKIPSMNGFELREQLMMNNVMKHRTTPFVFWTSHASPEDIERAYDLDSHGFFLKQDTTADLKSFLTAVMEYWLRSQTPNKLHF
jgi:CheY-like chemotaxis protein